MTGLVRQAVWDADLIQNGKYDKIVVRNLEVTINAGTDVWGRKKSQRALISVTVTLTNEFASASSTDSVDNSTIHYGTLSKAIQAQFEGKTTNWMSASDLSNSIAASAQKVAKATSIYGIETDVFFVKGSMFGDGAGQVFSVRNRSEGLHSKAMYLQNVRIPCVIGVNSNERLQKQPVVVNLWIDCIDAARADDYAKVESVLFKVISESSFQTLESLLPKVIDELKEKVFTADKDKDTWIKLRVEKPMAVPFADAPAVEMTRPVRSR
ncbi:hypothetical protein P153DRAFT_134907 [Dothidotthia symphoricarpi CBS 119687]|uniref:dihydroneopterin aldolase n=1 Tax=Dothidotthia symphoricarpi CBS 119687 TaxID=1392245 RepID=A0A6A6A0V6_9PLEO|nr:uncharacterized protein P153DRAFT_134907 [Dothidotthia symphoricarpi CBS 119687]KAF2124597.1 hypothetical protein P153DRAFT_134907 [Dothidotthia symphoricarpi CBS 119687]